MVVLDKYLGWFIVNLKLLFLFIDDVELGFCMCFIIVDIFGFIEGVYFDKGFGIVFFCYVEWVGVFVFVVDFSVGNVVNVFNVLWWEVGFYV